MDTDTDLDSGLLGIHLSDSEDDANQQQQQPIKNRAARDAQSEDAFREVKRNYKVKVENGEIWKTVKLPLGPHVPKPEAQALLHAVEELYFFRRYAEGARFVKSVLDGEDGVVGLDEEVRKTLRYYETKCNEREHAGSS